MDPKRTPIAISSRAKPPRRPQTMRPYRAPWLAGRGMVAALLGLAGASAVPAGLAQPSALVEPASQEHHLGKVIFVEMVTPDLAAAERFYAGLFGWTFRDIPVAGEQYAEASLDGRPIAALLQKDAPTSQHRQPAWVGFMAVPDVEVAKKTALEHGAKLLAAPHDVANRGREAVFADPQGAVFAVLASSSGDPPDALAAPGEWIWSSLITSDPDTDAAFYQAVFDYEVFDLDAAPGVQHLLLASDDYARASANTLPPDRPNARPHWLNYIRVDDAVKAAARVQTLGGRVLVEPRIDRQGGRVAVVADPLGAPFGLLEWPGDRAVEVAE